MAVYLIVEVKNGFLAWDADLKRHRQHRLSGLADGENIVHALDFGQHLLGGRGDQLFDFTRAGTGVANKYVGEGDINLRLFFLRRHHHRKEAQKHTDQCQKRRDGRVLEGGCRFA